MKSQLTRRIAEKPGPGCFGTEKPSIEPPEPRQLRIEYGAIKQESRDPLDALPAHGYSGEEKNGGSLFVVLQCEFA